MVFFVPLGDMYFDAIGEASSALDFSIFVDMVVSVVIDKNPNMMNGANNYNKQYSTRFFGQMPLVDGESRATPHCAELPRLQCALRHAAETLRVRARRCAAPLRGAQGAYLPEGNRRLRCGRRSRWF